MYITNTEKLTNEKYMSAGMTGIAFFVWMLKKKRDVFNYRCQWGYLIFHLSIIKHSFIL